MCYESYGVFVKFGLEIFDLTATNYSFRADFILTVLVVELNHETILDINLK